MISFGVGWQFIQLYETGIQTIFICFLIDESHNKNTGYFRGSEELRKLIGDTRPPVRVLTEMSLGYRSDLVPPKQRQAMHASHVTMSHQQMQQLSALSQGDLGLGVYIFLFFI